MWVFLLHFYVFVCVSSSSLSSAHLQMTFVGSIMHTRLFLFFFLLSWPGLCTSQCALWSTTDSSNKQKKSHLEVSRTALHMLRVNKLFELCGTLRFISLHPGPICLFGYDAHKSSWKYENLEATRGTILEAFPSWSRRTSKSCWTASQGTRLETHQIKFNGFHLIGFNINAICSADRTDCILRKQQGVKPPHIPCA